MAAAPQDNIETFLRNIPTQIDEARRQLFCDNINTIEFINILHQRSIDRQGDHADQQLQNDLGFLVGELQTMCSRYDDLLIRSESSYPLNFTCPLEESLNRGRRRYSIPQTALIDLHRIHNSWAQVAMEVGVSYRTLLRRRHEYSLPVSNTIGQRDTYTEISQTDLCDVVREVLQVLPNAGETFVLGALRQRNIRIQRWKVRNAIRTVDPLSVLHITRCDIYQKL